METLNPNHGSIIYKKEVSKNFLSSADEGNNSQLAEEVKHLVVI